MREGVKSPRAPLSLSNTLSFISKLHAVKRRLFVSASQNPNHNNVKWFKWREEVTCAPFFLAQMV